MKRIAVVGQPGFGKSTLARRLADQTGLPLYHMDHIHWKPGWVERDRNDRIAMATEVLLRDEWILEGNLSKINSLRIKRAEILIWLDLPFALRTWRIAKRTAWNFGRNRPDLQENCREGLNPSTLRFWKYIWDTRHSGRKKIEVSLLDAPPHLQVHRLKCPTDVQRFSNQFRV